jgi:hypothetical protein
MPVEFTNPEQAMRQRGAQRAEAERSSSGTAMKERASGGSKSTAKPAPKRAAVKQAARKPAAKGRKK